MRRRNSTPYGLAEEAYGIKKTIRLNPMPPNQYLDHLGSSYLGLKRSKEAKELFMKAVQTNPTDVMARFFMTC